MVTPLLGLLLTTCALMAAPAKDDDPAAQAQATLQRAAKLPRDHQRLWLRLIEQRYDWALLLTLKPDDAKRERARVEAVFRQKTVAWNDLIELLGQLDRREKAAISRLVRQYRTDVYETFGKRPKELVDRQEAWYRIWSLWEKAGSPPEQQDRLMDWLAGAIKASAKDSIGPLPPDPAFAADAPLVSEQLVKQLSQPPAKSAVANPAAPKPPAEESAPGPVLQARGPLALRVPDPRGAIGLVKRSSEAVAVRPAENSLSLSAIAAVPPVVVPPPHALSAIVAGDPGELTAPPAPPRLAVVLAVRRQPPSVAETAAEEHAQVNIEELSTRIEGINLSLRNLEAELTENREFTADQLDSLLSRLDILVLRQKDLTLFRDLVTPRQQAKLGQIESARPAVATMGTRIGELRTRLRETQPLPEADRAAALKHLDELSDRLATITAEK